MIKKYLNQLKKHFKTKNFSQQKPYHYFDISDFDEKSDSIGVEAYFNNAIIHRCINLITISASQVPWKIYKNVNSKLVIDTIHPANSLLNRPNPEQSKADFFSELISNLLLYGNGYIVSTHDQQSYPSELYLLHPKFTEVIRNDSYPIAFQYKNNNYEKIYQIDPITRISKVLWLKNYHPMDQYKGMSSLQAASNAVNLYAKIIQWNNALLNNASRPSGALVFEDSNSYLTDEQFLRLQEQFYANFTGYNNSGKPLILEGGLKWQNTANNQRLEKFIELKDSIARDIALTFNIPPQLLGISGDNTYSNMHEARFAFWEENIIPLLIKLSDALSNWLSYWFGEKLSIYFDSESISALSEKRRNIWENISNANFMTINEKRAFIGLAPLKEGDKLSNHDNKQ